MKSFIWVPFGQGKMWYSWRRDAASVTWRKVAQELVKDDTSVCLGKVGTWSLEQGFSCLGRWAVRNILALRGFFIKSNCPMGNLMRAKQGTVHHCISSDVVIGGLSLSFILNISLYICSSWPVTHTQGEFLTPKSVMTRSALFSEGFHMLNCQLAASELLLLGWWFLMRNVHKDFEIFFKGLPVIN